MNDFSVTFLGTSAALPTAERGLAATAVRHDGSALLVDCGEGTQRQLRRSRLGLVALDAVLLTHLHGDHYLGLFGLLSTYDLLHRRTPLTVCGPAGLRERLRLAEPLIGSLCYELLVHELQPGEVAPLGLRGLEVRGYATRHAVASLGYRISESPRPGTVDVAAARALGLEPGPLLGRLSRGESVVTDGRVVRPEQVVGAQRPGRTVVLTGDTEPCAETVEAARGADLLVHEATFVAADRAHARRTRHSCADEAAEVAVEAGVRSLALTHLSQRVRADEILAEAQRICPVAFVPDDLQQLGVQRPPSPGG